MTNKKPTGSKSAYNCFMQSFRKQYKAENSDLKINFSEFTKLVSERWKKLSDIEKKEFHELAAIDKKRYSDEMANYEPSEKDIRKLKEKKKAKKSAKDPNKPKRPMSAFFIFSNELRLSVKESNPEFKIGDIAKELARRWKECTNKDKYENLAKLAKEIYEDKMKEYNERLGGHLDNVTNNSDENRSSC